MLLDDYRPRWATEEHDDLRDMAREFCEKELAPNAERFAEQHEVDRDLWNKAGDAGLLCLSIPEEYGGGGGDFSHEAVLIEEQARVADNAWGNVIHSVICAHYILEYGTEEQKQHWLPKLATGEFVAAIGMTEPTTGSDLQAIRTKGVRDGDDYVIDGSKTFITNGSQANLIIIVTRTNEQPGHKGISLVVAETDGLEGFSRGRVLQKIGTHGQDTRELFFSQMRVPAANILGGEAGEGKGFYQLMQQLPQERLAVAVTGAAACEAAVRTTIDYTKNRQVFGKTVMDMQNTKFVLAECAGDTLAAKSMVDWAIEEHVAGKLTTEGASAAKFWATDMQCKVVDRCLQLHGGYGFMMEYPIARMYVDARVQPIYAGTNEIMKDLISRGF
ncbi:MULTISPECIES: acyl-CoA dehydrogenase family protein [unclassified Auritidibacter]|uniref:acyl-CoA dehydrogenase family protein n=1 Tax=unclassified Auritidibacter TaxID=2634694 RepID=UPI000D72C4C4|nr:MULTISPECIES: acyl-CoA dehydrogenase family protein [unclassified Auritidibacter]AXR74522.1 acyl-CoA dehydrogenase [Auritidibacter sp. NML130574]PXA77011.1 acyl-CoA dehydrogenase [Auritidibacter sp. NML100628]